MSETSESDSDNEAAYGDENFSQFECRACLKLMSRGFYNMYQPWNARVGSVTTVAEDLARIANIEVSELDPHSKVMCNKCCILLHKASQFIATVKRTNEILKLRDFYEVPIESGDKPWPKPIQLEKNINGSVFTKAMDVEVKQEVVSDDENEGMNHMAVEVRTDLDVDIKTEPEDMEQHPPIKVTVKGTISTDQEGGQNLVISNGCAIYESEEYLDTMVKEEPMSEDEGQGPFDISPDCMLCSKSFYSISGLKAHVISQHSYKSVKRKTGNSASPEKKTSRYTCGTCRRSFATSTDLMVHETCHNKSVCYSCNAKFDTFDQLIKHRKRCKAILNKQVSKPKMLEDVIRPLPPNVPIIRPVSEAILKKSTQKCSICSEEFSEDYYMKIHHEIYHTNSNEQNPNRDGETNKLKKSDQTKKSIADNKMETENLQRMFEQTEKCPPKASRNETDDCNSKEKPIKKSEMNVQEKDKINRIDKTINDDSEKTKCYQQNNKHMKQNEQVTKNINREHRNNAALSVKSDQKDVNKHMDLSDCIEIKHITEHREDSKQGDKSVKVENNEHISMEYKESEQLEKSEERKQLNKGSEHAEASETLMSISEQKQCEKSKQNTNVLCSTKIEQAEEPVRANTVIKSEQ